MKILNQNTVLKLTVCDWRVKLPLSELWLRLADSGNFTRQSQTVNQVHFLLPWIYSNHRIENNFEVRRQD